jgi:hypothetical protein
MTYPSTITITGSTSITNFDIYQCTTNDCSTCVPISGVTGQDVSRSQLLTGHTVSVGVGYRYIKLSSDTETCTNSICMEIIGLPTPTPTSTPTPTPSSTPTPTPTSTPTPTPSSTPVPEPPTPTPSSTPVPPTPVPPTPVPPTPTIEMLTLDYQGTINGQQENNTGSFAISVGGTAVVVSYDASFLGSINVPYGSEVTININSPQGGSDPTFSSRILVTDPNVVADSGPAAGQASSLVTFTITSNVIVNANTSVSNGGVPTIN